MAKSTTDQSLTYISIALAKDASGEVPPEPMSLTEALRRALIERPGEAGALGSTWTAREAAERQAGQFCQARPADCVASAKGEYRARVYELADDRWGVVVWYTLTAEKT
jgi:hypothetical protein